MKKPRRRGDLGRDRSSVARALTLLPCAARPLGDSINALRLHWIGRNTAREDASGSPSCRGPMRRPCRSSASDFRRANCSRWPFPAFGLNLGASRVRTLPARLRVEEGVRGAQRAIPPTYLAPGAFLIAVGLPRSHRPLSATSFGCGATSRATRLSRRRRPAYRARRLRAASACASPAQDCDASLYCRPPSALD